MRHVPSIAVVVALLTLLAGCGAFSAQAPAATDWAEPDSSLPAELPPGVSQSGVESDALLAAHQRNLAGAAVVVTRNVTGPSGSGGVRAAATADRSRALVRYDTTGPDRTVYLAGDRMFVRTQRGTDTDVRVSERTPNASTVPDDFAFDGPVRTFLENAAHEPVGTVERDGRTLVVLEADADDARAEFAAGGDANVTSLRSQLLVAPDGTVVEHRATLTVAAAGGDANTYDYRYAVDTDDVRVERPQWATDE